MTVPAFLIKSYSMPLGTKYELGLSFPASEVKMSDSPIKYRLIKKEKHTGARLGEIITPHGTFQRLCLCQLGPKLL